PAIRPQQQRQIEVPRRRAPDVAAPAAPCGLLVGPDDRAGGTTRARQRLCLVVGTADAGEMMEPVAVRERRSAIAHRWNNEAAAASAPPTIGSGSRMNTIVRTAVTTSTHFNSAAIGLSNATSGSSKYITLTMRR